MPSPRFGLARILVHGAGDVGSAVALALLARGGAPVLLEGSEPRTTRRRMAFADAVFDGACRLEGVWAVRADRRPGPGPASEPVIPLHVEGFCDLPPGARFDVFIDARMRKRAVAAGRIGDAPLCIGLGPGFTAPEHCDLVIETGHGPALGAVIERGAARAADGLPQEIAGTRGERQVRATAAGRFAAAAAIGDAVQAGQLLGRVGEARHLSPFPGIVRGIVRDGVAVEPGTRLAEVVPAGSGAAIEGVGARPRRIGEGVVAALRARGVLG